MPAHREDRLERTRSKKLKEVSKFAVGITLFLLSALSSVAPIVLSRLSNAHLAAKIIIALIIAIVVGLIFYSIYDVLFNHLLQRSKSKWLKENPDIIIGDKLYIIQINPDDIGYLRIGETDSIEQAYDEYRIVHTTYNVQYNESNERYEYCKGKKAQITRTVEDATIDEDKNARGIYRGRRSDNSEVYGIFSAIIVPEHDGTPKIDKIDGTFCDESSDGKKPRHGQKTYFSDKAAFYGEVEKICRKRGKELGLGETKYQSYIAEVQS